MCKNSVIIIEISGESNFLKNSIIIKIDNMQECVKIMMLFMVFFPFSLVFKYSMTDLHYVMNSKIRIKSKTKM